MKSNKKSRKTPEWVSASQGWKSVDVGEDLLLGAAEGGFAGLEALEDCNLLTDLDLSGGEIIEEVPASKAPQSAKSQHTKKRDAAAADKDTAPAARADNSKQPKKQRTAGAGAAASSGDKTDDVQTLQQQLEQLKRENEQLKAVVSGAAVADGEGDAGAAGEAVLSAGALKRKQKLEAYKAKMAERRHQRKERQNKKKQTKKQGAAAGSHADAEDASEPASEEPGTEDGQEEEEGEGRGGQHAKAQTQKQTSTGSQQPLADVSAWKVFSLHPLLEKGLALQGFLHPTEVQSQVLPAAIRDKLDVIGAAQTGSGKTLAFGLPIMQTLLEEREVCAAEGTTPPNEGKLRALIMAPTRELALQVEAHLTVLGKVVGIRVAAIVGGLAHVKQERLLRAKPAIVVATPGRLWELLREQASPHLSDMSGLRFLVLDEADRMVAKGHFQELSSILALVPNPKTGLQKMTYDPDFEETLKTANELERRRQARKDKKKVQRDGNEGQDGEDAKASEEEEEAGSEGTGSGDEMDSEEQHEGDDAVDSDQPPSDGEAAEGEEEQLQEGQDGQLGQGGTAAGEEGLPGGGEQQGPRKQQGNSKGFLLQTMVFSATLTLPAALRKRLKRGGGGALGGTDLDNLMDRVPFRGTPRIVDLSSARRLAEGVSESVINCLSGTDRDANLYYLLARHPGRALVFVNAVSALRRVAALLKILGLPAHALHAQQQQRQRLKALDAFKNNDQAVLVATDVAARGLDVKNVRMVIHYQLPASVDTYIHRSGRTARGQGQEGTSVALVAPEEAARWQLLVKAVGHEQPPPAFPVDATLMPKVVERLKLALRIDEEERTARKAAAEVSWEQRAAIEAGLADEDADRVGRKQSKKRALIGSALDEEDDAVLTAARQNSRKAAALASLKQQLGVLLSQPLAPRMSKAYFTGGATAGVAVSSEASRGGSGLNQHQQTAAAAVSQAVSLAARMQQATAAPLKQQGQQGRPAQAGAVANGVGQKPKQKVKKQKRPSVEQLARQELARRAAVKKAKKQGKGAVAGSLGFGLPAGKQKGKGGAGAGMAGGGRKRGLVTIHPALSRDAQGQDALAALKRKLGAL